MRTLHCRSAASVVCPSSPLSFFFPPARRLSRLPPPESRLWCHSTVLHRLFLFFCFGFFPRAHLTMRGIHTIMTCDRMSSADLVPPIPPSVPHPPTDATPAPSCTHPAESCCLPDVNGARLIVSAEGIGPSVVLQHGGNTPHLVVTGLNSPPPVVLNDLVFLFHIFSSFCASPGILLVLFLEPSLAFP